ncbi:MAG: type I pullulanase [Bacteroidetes bacterium]|nr:type I pullulanase [Bacteroidota bacterium]
MAACKSPKPVLHFDTDRYPLYNLDELGMEYHPERSIFKIWAPTASAARLLLYAEGTGGKPLQTINLQKGPKGSWTSTIPGNQLGKYYAVQVKNGGKWLAETPSPWAKAVGVNGLRGQIIDLKATNPPGWEKDTRPALKNPTDIILYELHIRDASSSLNSGIQHKGQYLGLTETGAKNQEGLPTGLDHMKELGITHVHLLPAFDFRSIDERLPADKRPFNWGYDPENYNAPEGSYATDPNDGAVRIREFKQMVQALHQAGIRVVMDVVYNHTGSTDESAFNRIEPGYFYRKNADGSYSNASGCGNETASERPMMRQFMIESVLYWAKEYHIDGFRFDLMGIHDMVTMNRIRSALNQVDPAIFLYGEGWTSGGSPLPDSLRALKANTWKLDGIAAFSDDLRDALKGSVFDQKDRGFVSGKPEMEESIKFGIVGATRHKQIDYNKINYSKAPWAGEPAQCINYVNCHDNHTLWDKLAISCPDESTETRIKMNKLAAAIVLTSQGVPFLHAGEEMLRSKKGVENSFNAPDSINQMDWNLKTAHLEVFEYYKNLIQLRKHHPAFRMRNAEQINAKLEFLPVSGSQQLVAYRIQGNANGDPWSDILVLFNGSSEATTYLLPAGNWNVVLDENGMDEKGLRSIRGRKVTIPGISAMILVVE